MLALSVMGVVIVPKEKITLGRRSPNGWEESKLRHDVFPIKAPQ